MDKQEIITALEKISEFQVKIIEELKLIFDCRKIKKRIYLSRKEYEIVSLMAKGLNNNEIAEKMNIKNTTVKTHISHIYSLIDKKGKEKSIMRVKTVLMFLKGYIGEKINVDKKRC